MKLSAIIIAIISLTWSCQKEEIFQINDPAKDQVVTMREKPGGETAGNNLSFPVIWAEGHSILPVPAEALANRFQYRHRNRVGSIWEAVIVEPLDYTLEGEWWYWWGVIEGSENQPDQPLVCFPNPADELVCLDGSDPDPNWEKAYVQKDPNNFWQAVSFDAGSDEQPVEIDWVDWGDNLESVNWNTRSKVRTEVVLLADNPNPVEPWMEYRMDHVSGWGIDEVHGLAVNKIGDPITPFNSDLGMGLQATVYSHCARLLIQKITDPDQVGDLKWEDGEWTGAINPPIFDGAVYEGGDGPGFYSAEVNVKGKVIYGYTWDVRRLHDPAEPGGYYRITFALDGSCGGVYPSPNATLKNAFVKPMAETEAVDDGDTEGGEAFVVGDNELTYIDVYIEDGTGKPGSGNGNSSGTGGGNPGDGKGNKGKQGN